MKCHYIIDGYNLMHAIPLYRNRMQQDLNAARDHCILRLSGMATRENVKITAVFDGDRSGQCGESIRSHINVIFSKPPANADSVIKRMADSPSKAGGEIVVTSDQEIVRFARQCGIKTMSSARFVQYLTQPMRAKNSVEMKYERGLSTKEVDMWMELFQGQSSESETSD